MDLCKKQKENAHGDYYWADAAGASWKMCGQGLRWRKLWSGDVTKEGQILLTWPLQLWLRWINKRKVVLSLTLMELVHVRPKSLHGSGGSLRWTPLPTATPCVITTLAWLRWELEIVARRVAKNTKALLMVNTWLWPSPNPGRCSC